MITFDDIRRGKDVTFFFYAASRTGAFQHFLEEAMVTGWEILPKNKVKPYLPKGFEIPEVYVHEYAPRPERNVDCFVSYYNVDDLQKKFYEIMHSREYHAWLKEISDRSLKRQEYDDKWVKDPSPFSSLRAIADALAGNEQGGDPTT